MGGGIGPGRPGEHELRPRLEDARLVRFERAPDQRSQPPLRQTFGQRIDRNRERRFAANRVQHFGLRMIDGARSQRIGLAVNQHFVSRPKVFFHERQVPPAAVEPCRSVIEDKLEDRFAATAPPFDALRDDLAARGSRLAQSQLGDGRQTPAIFMAPRPVQ